MVWGFVVQMRKAVPTRARDTDGCLPSRGDSVPMVDARSSGRNVISSADRCISNGGLR